MGPTVDAYRIAGYTDSLLGAGPECDILKPHYDSGLKWADSNNPQPTDPLWDGGFLGGITWDGTFYRDVARYPTGGQFFWSVYLKPGSSAGIKNGYWYNFGSGWCHLADDDYSQMLTGACPRIYWDGAGNWRLVIEATLFVTGTKVEVWTGYKPGGNDPTGQYTRVTGRDPLLVLTVESL